MRIEEENVTKKPCSEYSGIVQEAGVGWERYGESHVYFKLCFFMINFFFYPAEADRSHRARNLFCISDERHLLSPANISCPTALWRHMRWQLCLWALKTALEMNRNVRHTSFHSLNAFTDVPRDILGWERVVAGRSSLIVQTEIKHFLVLSSGKHFPG